MRRGLTLVALAVVALPALGGGAAARAKVTKAHGCGVLVAAAHPWRSHVVGGGGKGETGDHWITDWRGAHGTCAFTRARLHRLLSFSSEYLDTAFTHGVAHYKGGVCRARYGTDLEVIAPFQRVRCTLPVTIRRHRYTTTIEAFVDPDPRFIH